MKLRASLRRVLFATSLAQEVAALRKTIQEFCPVASWMPKASRSSIQLCIVLFPGRSTEFLLAGKQEAMTRASIMEEHRFPNSVGQAMLQVNYYRSFRGPFQAGLPMLESFVSLDAAHKFRKTGFAMQGQFRTPRTQTTSLGLSSTVLRWTAETVHIGPCMHLSHPQHPTVFSF